MVKSNGAPRCTQPSQDFSLLSFRTPVATIVDEVANRNFAERSSIGKPPTLDLIASISSLVSPSKSIAFGFFLILHPPEEMEFAFPSDTFGQLTVLCAIESPASCGKFKSM